MTTFGQEKRTVDYDVKQEAEGCANIEMEKGRMLEGEDEEKIMDSWLR